jgi:hypothetical protein
MLMLDRTIEDKLANKDKKTQKQILNKLSKEYQEFADVFSKIESGLLPLYRPIDYKVELLPGAAPLQVHPLYSISINQLIALKKYLTKALRKEWIVPNAAEYGSPVLFAKKPNGGLRFCVDYRAVNARSKKDVYLLPLISEILKQLGKAKIFTKLNVRNAFHRIRMNEASEDIITFRTRFSQYKYQILPFGLSGDSSIFQRYINSVFFPYLDKFCTAYVDDILIFLENPSDHRKHIAQILKKLRNAGL